MVGLWKVFCRSIFEQTCPVWSSSLTDQNKSDLERVLKTFVKLILEEDYTNYQNRLSNLHLNTLEERRNILTLRFAKTSLADGLLRDLFPQNVSVCMKYFEMFWFYFKHWMCDCVRKKQMLHLRIFKAICL